MTPHEILQKHWGYSSFRPLQEAIVQAVLDGKDVLALLPTGGGKSICFQVPAMMRAGTCIVVSPLIALMKDQVDQLKRRGVAATAIFAGMKPQAIDLTLDNCVYGQIKFLYVSPERLKTELLQERVKKMSVSLLVVDEAHCVSQWGYDFRPPYLEIAAFRALIPGVNTIALTATATPAVKQDIQEKLDLRQPAVFQKSFAHNNLAYVVRKTENKGRQLLKILHHIPGTAIVYVNSRKKTKLIAQLLKKNGISTAFYNAGLTTLERVQQQEAWIKGNIRVMVATNAFGMGIDKPNVRLVVHMDLPTTLEAYYQEAGRAGRDEKKAYAIALYEDYDIALLRESIQAAHPTIDQLKKVYQHLANYYKVAIGSHTMTTYDFDLEDFAHTCDLKPQAVYQALKVLEQEGLVQLNETFFQTAQLQIPTDPKELYAFQVAHVTYDPLIKALLRMYGGAIFSEFCSISEQKIAKLLYSSPQEVKKQLQALDHLSVIQYHPQKDQPQLTFTTARHPASQLPLDIQKLKQRSALAIKKGEAVIHYVTHQHRCRPQLLLEYFGEISYEKCKQCDICLEKKKGNTDNKAAAYKKYRTLILQHLQEGINDVVLLVDKIDPQAEKEVLMAIRQMLDSEELSYDQVGRLLHQHGGVQQKHSRPNLTFTSST